MSGSQRPTGYTFPILIALGVCNHTVLTGSRVTVSLYAISLGASPLVIGTLMGLYAFLPMWLAVSAGRLSDRIGVRKPMLLGSCGIALGAALPYIAPGLPSLYGATSLIGLSFMLFQLATQNATGTFGGPADRPKNFSLLALGYSVSGLTGPLLSGFMIDHASFAATFIVLSLLPLVPIAVLARGAMRLPGPQRERARGAMKGIAELFGNARLRRVFLVNGLLSMAWDLHTFFIPIYGAGIGLSASRIGVVLAAFAAATFVVRLAMSWISRRFTEFQVLSGALFLAALSYAAFPLVSVFELLLAISFTLGLALGSGQPMVMSLLHSLAPAGRMGEAVGLRMSIINASTFAVPLLFGAVGASVGIAPVFWAVGACLAGGGMLARRR